MSMISNACLSRVVIVCLVFSAVIFMLKYASSIISLIWDDSRPMFIDLMELVVLLMYGSIFSDRTFSISLNTISFLTFRIFF